MLDGLHTFLVNIKLMPSACLQTKMQSIRMDQDSLMTTDDNIGFQTINQRL